jgi:hypothetical protein
LFPALPAPVSGFSAPVRGPALARLHVIDGHVTQPQDLVVALPVELYDNTSHVLDVLVVSTFSM